MRDDVVRVAGLAVAAALLCCQMSLPLGFPRPTHRGNRETILSILGYLRLGSSPQIIVWKRAAGGRRVREARSRMPGRALSGLSVGYLIPPTDWHPRGQVLSAVGNNLWILGPGRPVDYYKRRSLHALLSVFIAGGTI